MQETKKQKEDTKIIFLDIDGTIIPEETHIIPQSAIDSILKAQSMGHLVYINTGRVWFNIDKALREIPFDGFICGCGTYILYQGNILYHHKTPEDICHFINESAKRHGLDPLFEAEHGLYCDDDMYHNETAKKFVNHLRKSYDIRKVPTNLQFDKFVTWNSEGSDLQGFIKEVSPYFAYINRSEIFSEFVPLNHSKATGIQFLIDKLGLKKENTYAIGDGPNDLEMLHFVEHSIIMGNAKPAYMLNEAKHVTKHILEDGILYAFENFILND